METISAGFTGIYRTVAKQENAVEPKGKRTQKKVIKRLTTLRSFF